MQHSQRARRNEALEYAVQRANDQAVPLLVGFGLTEDYPDGSERHFRFMLEGIAETAEAIRRRNIGFVLRLGCPPKVAIELSKDAVEVVTDRGYLRHHRRWRREVAKGIDVRLTQVESDLIVPVDCASEKREYAARTIRKQINQAAGEYHGDLSTTAVNHHFDGSIDGEDTDDVAALLDKMTMDRSIKPVDWIHGGYNAAASHLESFMDRGLSGYDEGRSDVLAGNCSVMSPYLHFGMISPIDVYNQIGRSNVGRTADRNSYLEELLVRRELAHNFVYYAEDDYDSLSALPNWARETLQEHSKDEREHHYTAGEFESAETHDALWNAAMTEMKNRGYLHNQLRMYWGKKFIQWTNTPEHAHRTLLNLNNKYFLDGRDANSYSNALWIFGLHDRAWTERPIFGKVRYMSRGGTEKKFDSTKYISQIMGD